jgi:hypothetical protein
VLDSVVFNKKCSICTKHEACTGSLYTIHKHIYVKSYDSLSKSMESSHPSLTALVLKWETLFENFNEQVK